jgi:hypothetical protein
VSLNPCVHSTDSEILKFLSGKSNKYYDWDIKMKNYIQDLSSKSKFRYVVLLNFVVYLILLVGRGWGAHRMLNNEERIAVGTALSQNLFLSINDWSYGTLFTRILIQLAVKSPLEYLPITLFSIATLLWAVYSLIIFWLILLSP